MDPGFSRNLFEVRCVEYMGYLRHKKPHPSQDHHRSQGIVLLQVFKGRRFLLSELPLYGRGGGDGSRPQTGEGQSAVLSSWIGKGEAGYEPRSIRELSTGIGAI